MFVVGGYVMPTDAAREMSKEWAAELSDFSVACFHMNEVPDGKKHFAHLERELRYALTRRLIRIINHYADMAFVCAVNPLLRVPAKYFSTDPYAYAAQQCVEGICRTIGETDPHAKIMFFFEKGHSTENETNKMLLARYAIPELAAIMKHHFAGMSFLNKQDICLLQAADILVWQTAKYIKNKLKDEEPTREFKELLGVRKHRFMFIANDDSYVYLHLLDKPLVGNGDGLRKFFRENKRDWGGGSITLGRYTVNFGKLEK
jgi:hypothetical protein